MSDIPVIEIDVVSMAKRDPPKGRPFNLLVIGCAAPKKVTINHIKKVWAFSAANIGVRGGHVLKGDWFLDPADRKKPKQGKPPHEVKRWRWHVSNWPKAGTIRVGQWQTPNEWNIFEGGNLCADAERLMSRPVSCRNRIEVELRNGQRVFMRYNPKPK